MTDTVIFDLDGTLIDTEKYFKVFWIQAAAQFGYTMSEEQALTLRSMGRPFAPDRFKEWFGADCDYDKIRDYRRLLMTKHLVEVGIELKPGVCETLEWLKKNNYFIALCTATPLDRATQQLIETGIYSDCSVTLPRPSSEDVKPDSIFCILSSLSCSSFILPPTTLASATAP